MCFSSSVSMYFIIMVTSGFQAASSMWSNCSSRVPGANQTDLHPLAERCNRQHFQKVQARKNGPECSICSEEGYNQLVCWQSNGVQGRLGAFRQLTSYLTRNTCSELRSLFNTRTETSRGHRIGVTTVSMFRFVCFSHGFSCFCA